MSWRLAQSINWCVCNSVVARKAPHGGDVQISIESGLEGLKVLKTSKSSFVDFFRDPYTTLPDVPDRLVASVVTATWKYTSEAVKCDFQQQAEDIKRVMIETFSGPADVGVDSPAVQFTLYKMGEAVLEQCPSVKEITITMPNVHNLPVDLTRFGLKNKHPHGEIFLPTDEPHGIIRATMVRATSKL
jgi:urate oxidase